MSTSNSQGKLSLKDVRVTLPFEIVETTMFDGLDRIKKYGYKIDFDVYLKTKGKNLQRGFVWTIEQKRELIFSVLKGIDFGRITAILFTNDMSNRSDKTYLIIDGKQRLSTLLSFVDNEFSIIFDGKEYFFNDLDKSAQDVFDRMWLRGNIAYAYPDQDISDDDKIRWFELINFIGTPQDLEHLKNLKA